MLWENIKLAVGSFFGNKLRTLLSILGIVIGVGSVILITTLGKSATASVTANIASAGVDTISVFPGRSMRDAVRLFVPELGEEIAADIDGITHVIPYYQSNYTLRAGRESSSSRVIGVNEYYDDIFHYEAAEGTFLTSDDLSGRKSVIVLGSEVAALLYPEGGALGKYIRVFRGQTSRSFKVIGIMAERSSSLGVDFNTSTFIPGTTYSERFQRTDMVTGYAIGTQEGADVLDISKQIESFLLAKTGTADAYRVVSPSTIAEMYNTVTNTLNLLLGGVAAISLLVGGIGIMNIMLVSVTERTKEIGVRKAMGATPGNIRGQFLTEAFALTIFGGIIGMGIGLAAGYFITRALGWGFAVEPVALMLALGFAGFVGVFFGWYPAARAARLDPIQALMYE